MADTIQQHVHIVTCPRCGKKAPEFDEQGKHNFCPASKGNKVVTICMECKMRDVTNSWGWQADSA